MQMKYTKTKEIGYQKGTRDSEKALDWYTGI